MEIPENSNNLKTTGLKRPLPGKDSRQDKYFSNSSGLISDLNKD